jgi:Tfp pilus assembly protein PilN
MIAPPAARTPPAAVEPEALNLARRPFVNSRPVVRVAVLLWLLGFLLLLGNVALFWSYLAGSGEKRAELAQRRAAVERERTMVTQLQGRLDAYDLERQNRKVSYLNRKIGERTFSWSLLFDRLAEVLPDDVRLYRLAPQGVVKKEPQGQGEGSEEPPVDRRVTLTITGAAKNDETLLRFIDNLFAHPAFSEPDLSRETREEEKEKGKEKLLRFDVQVKYVPGALPASPVSPASPARPVIEEGAPPAVPAPPHAPPPHAAAVRP